MYIPLSLPYRQNLSVVKSTFLYFLLILLYFERGSSTIVQKLSESSYTYFLIEKR